MKWITFWFEGNLAWGLITCPNDWERIKVIYGNDCSDAKMAPIKETPYFGYSRKETPYFGYSIECVGPQTLGEWAKDNNITL